MVYMYDDLKTGEEIEIRLVTLEGINEITGELICRLDTARLNDALEYRALSYCWGDASKQSTIICNGHRLLATPNLVAALRCLLSKGKADNLSLTFWVDSICINQRNNEEKKVQVVLMGDIYRQALQVLVWLGPASDSSDLAFEVCHRLWRQESEVQNISRKKSSLSTIGKTTTWGTDLEPFTHMLFDDDGKFDNRGIHKFVKEMDAVQDMLMRPWWSRVWIIQEVTLAKHVVVVCGDAMIDWGVLMTGIIACLARPWAEMFINLATAHYARVLYQVRQAVMYTRNDPARLLFHLASQCRWSKATNPRDKIYGLLGLISGGNESSLVKVDYSQSVEDCYCTAVLDIIKSSGSLEVLQLCRRPPGLKSTAHDGSPKLPSWVPDMRLDTSDFQSATNLSMLDTIGLQSCPGIKEVMAEHSRIKTQLFRASKGSREHDPRSDGNGILIVSGLMFDTISGLGEMLTGLEAQEDARLIAQFDYIREVRARTHTPWKFIKSTLKSASGFVKLLNASGEEILSLVKWRQMALSQKCVYPNGETLAHAFSATLYRGLLGDDPEKILEDHDVEWKRIMGKVESLDRIIPAKCFSQRSKFRRVMACLAWSCATFVRTERVRLKGFATYYRFAATKLGYFALLPHEAHEGDTIALLRGAPVPFALRKTTKGDVEAGWEVIGPCYLHGIMYGEQWKEELCRPIRLV